MKTRKRKKRNRKVDDLFQSVHQEMVDQGFVEELPGGYVRLTPKGREEQQRVINDPKTKAIMRLCRQAHLEKGTGLHTWYDDKI